MSNWRNTIDKTIRDNLELQVKESAKYRNSYLKAKNPSNAQLWVAIANLSAQIFDLHLKLNFLEKALQDIAKPKGGKQQDKKAETPEKTKRALDKNTKTLKKSLKKF